MQSYQPYYQNNQYQPMQPNPYMQRLENLQQFQQSLQPQPMTQTPLSNQFPALGKIVESIDIVKATDIPMDGNMYYFPTADGSMVYGKQWLSNGTTRILPFKPFLESNTDILSTEPVKIDYGAMEEVLNVFLKRFDTMEERFKDLEQSMTKSITKTSVSRTKKENETE